MKTKYGMAKRATARRGPPGGIRNAGPALITPMLLLINQHAYAKARLPILTRRTIYASSAALIMF